MGMIALSAAEQGVDREQSERGRAVDQDKIEFRLHLFKRRAQHSVAVLLVDEIHFRPGKIDV